MTISSLNVTTTKRVFFGLWVLFCSLQIQSAPVGEPVKTPLLDSIVAVVDEGIILKSELDATIKQFYRLNINRKQAVPSPDVVRRQVVEQMIVEKAQLQLAERSGIKISDASINSAIEQLAQQNKRSVIDYRDQLTQEFGSYQAARDSIRDQLMINQLRERQIAQSITITDDEVKFFLAQNQKQSEQRQFLLRHILIGLPNQPSEEDTAKASQLVDEVMTKLAQGADFAKLAMTYSSSPTALEGGLIDWRQQNELPTLLNDRVNTLLKGRVLAPIRTPGGYHIFKVEDIKGGRVSVVTYYNLRHILIKPSVVRDDSKSKTLAEELRAKIAANPDDFTQLAKTYSDDPGSAKDGGVLEKIQEQQVVDTFRDMMVNTPVGEISPVFKTNYGWHFLQVLEKKHEDVGSTLALEEAKRALYRRKFEEKLVPWIRKVRQEAFVEIML